jgi:adenosylcobinamide-GDP ribazoletransferase
MRGALATLTRLPMGAASGADHAAAAFGVVGALVGVAGLAVMWPLGTAAPLVSAPLALAAMVVLSGALHLDGLADTADALLAVDPASAERARKDPALGPGGATALLLVLALEAGSLATLAVDAGGLAAGVACVVAGSVSRALAVVVALAGRDRASDGWGGGFARRASPGAAAVAGATAGAVIVGAATLGFRAPAVGGVAGAAIGLGLGWWILRARMRLDGDALGATVELGFCACLVASAVTAAWLP